jgi:hypothetical protein
VGVFILRILPSRNYIFRAIETHLNYEMNISLGVVIAVTIKECDLMHQDPSVPEPSDE